MAETKTGLDFDPYEAERDLRTPWTIPAGALEALPIPARPSGQYRTVYETFSGAPRELQSFELRLKAFQPTAAEYIARAVWEAKAHLATKILSARRAGLDETWISKVTTDREREIEQIPNWISNAIQARIMGESSSSWAGGSETRTSLSADSCQSQNPLSTEFRLTVTLRLLLMHMSPSRIKPRTLARYAYEAEDKDPSGGASATCKRFLGNFGKKRPLPGRFTIPEFEAHNSDPRLSGIFAMVKKKFDSK